MHKLGEEFEDRMIYEELGIVEVKEKNDKEEPTLQDKLKKRLQKQKHGR